MELVGEYVRGLPKDTIIVTGAWPSLAGGYRVVEATSGVDREAYAAAEAAGLITVLVSGSKTKHGNLAGVQRNPTTVAISEAVTAFWDLRSTGTMGNRCRTGASSCRGSNGHTKRSFTVLQSG
jgi:hypothetical protein